MADTLGRLLRNARTARGLSVQAVADHVGVSRQAVSQWENDTNQPSTESLFKARAFLGIPLREIERFAGTATLTASAERLNPEPPEFARVARERQPNIGEFERDVPVYGLAVAGDDADFHTNGSVVDYVRRPLGIQRARNVYAIHVVGTSMSPRFDDGELVYVSSGRPPAIGDYVIIELRPREGEITGRGYLKRLLKRTPTKIVVEQFQPPKTLEFQLDEIAVLHRVIPWNEVLGV